MVESSSPRVFVSSAETGSSSTFSSGSSSGSLYSLRTVSGVTARISGAYAAHSPSPRMPARRMLWILMRMGYRSLGKEPSPASELVGSQYVSSPSNSARH